MKTSPYAWLRPRHPELETGEFGGVNLDVLRGWSQTIDPQLQRPHALPALAQLVHLDSGHVEPLHGPDLLIGRYYPPNGPVDIVLSALQEHERYRLGAPHLQLTLDEAGQWRASHLAPGTGTGVGARWFEDYNQQHPVNDGDILTLGCARYRFEQQDVALSAWKKACMALLKKAQKPALFLCRSGAPCGPMVELSPDTTRVIGRTLPPSGDRTVRTPWDHSAHHPGQPDVDLAGLYPGEAQSISFLHAAIRPAQPPDAEVHAPEGAASFRVTPISTRQKTFVNRQEISDSATLQHGDELALGSVFFYLHSPEQTLQIARAPLRPPALIDWGEGRSSLGKTSPLPDAPAPDEEDAPTKEPT